MSTETRQQLIYGDGALQKASLTYKNPQSGKNTTIPVQFNPTEYSIQRSLKYESHTGQGEEAHPDDQQASRSGLAMLNVSLILDTSTQMQDYQIPKGLSKYLNDSKELTSICQDISLIMKRNAENHEPSMVTFSWGSMAFYGHVTSLKISYQMFNLNGMPVRAKLDMEISGEDKSILNIIGANPHESPTGPNTVESISGRSFGCWQIRNIMTRPAGGRSPEKMGSLIRGRSITPDV